MSLKQRHDNTCSSGDMLANRQTDRQKIHNPLLLCVHRLQNDITTTTRSQWQKQPPLVTLRRKDSDISSLSSQPLAADKYPLSQIDPCKGIVLWTEVDVVCDEPAVDGHISLNLITKVSRQFSIHLRQAKSEIDVLRKNCTVWDNVGYFCHGNLAKCRLIFANTFTTISNGIFL